MSKLPEFLKPNAKKIITTLLIILSPYLLSMVASFSSRLFLLDWLGDTWRQELLMFLFWGFCTDCGIDATPFLIIIPLKLLIEILFLYTLSCLIVDKVSMKLAIAIFFVFVILLSVLPNIGTSDLIVNKTVPKISKMDDIYDEYLQQEYPYLKFQELTVQNNFFLPTMYNIKHTEDVICHNVPAYGLAMPDGSIINATSGEVWVDWNEVIIVNNKTEIRSPAYYGVGTILIEPYSKKRFYLGRLQVSAEGNSKEFRQQFNGDYLLFSKDKVGTIEGTECALAKEEDVMAKITIND